MVKRLCISISDEDFAFIDIMQLSPSGIFKQRLDQIRKDSANYQDKLKALEGARDVLQQKVMDYDRLLTENGIVH